MQVKQYKCRGTKKANMVDPILNFKVKLVVNYYNTSGSSAENANVDSASAVSDLN